MLTRFLYSLRYLPALLVAACLAPCVRAQNSTPPPAGGQATTGGEQVVISVGDDKITASEMEKIIQALPPQFRAYYTGAGKPLLSQYIVQMMILSGEAAKHNLANQPEVREALNLSRQSILADAERKRIAASIQVSDQQLQELYEKRKAEFEQVRIAHILLRTDKSAFPPPSAPSRPPLPEVEARKKLEDLRKQLQDGADFAELARNYSEDLSTAGAGGDMGYVNPQTVVPPILNAAKALSPGQVSEIITTPYGLEIIKVEDKHTKSLAEATPELQAQIRQETAQGIIEKLADQYHVVVDTSYFAAAKQTPNVPPSPPAPKK